MRVFSSFITLACVTFTAVLPAALAPSIAPAEGPDPKEIPVPEIIGPMGKLPGVNALPVNRELPDILTFNDGSRVTAKEQWLRRRAEIKRTLEYYAIGQ